MIDPLLPKTNSFLRLILWNVRNALDISGPINDKKRISTFQVENLQRFLQSPTKGLSQ